MKNANDDRDAVCGVAVESDESDASDELSRRLLVLLLLSLELLDHLVQAVASFEVQVERFDVRLVLVADQLGDLLEVLAVLLKCLDRDQVLFVRPSVTEF